MIESPLLQHLEGYIDGRWTGAGVGRPVAVTNPVNGEVLAELPGMGSGETAEAIDAAKAALTRDAPSLAQRRAWLEGIVNALHKHREEIGRILCLEHGKPWPEAQGEVDYAAGFFRYMAANIDELKPRTLAERPRDLEWTVHYRPAGVVGLITPWNFPIGMIAKKLSAAIAAGCPSVTRPSAKTPLTMVALFHVLDQELDLPPGFANLVVGPSGPVGDTLCEHPDVAMLSFTGSTGVGQELIRKTADKLKRLSLELGGNAPFIIFEDADLDAAADNLIANKFRGGGQTCVCANRVLVQKSVADDFLERFAARAAKLKVGDGMDKGVDIGPLVDRNGYEKVRRHLLDCLDKGATPVHGEDPGPLDNDWGGFFPPVIVRGVTTEMEAACEETFGPLVPVMEFSDEAEALALANRTEFGLASYLFTGDDARAERMIARLEFGHTGWNTGSGPAPEAPFGGVKQSGYGREGGLEGLFEFIEPQTVPRG